MAPEIVVPVEETIEDLTGVGEVAILTLAWALRRRVNDRILLSATLELCSTAIEPFDGALRRSEVSERFFGYCRRYSLSGPEGLGWFKECAAGRVQLPPAERADTKLDLQPLLAEPPWPRLSSPWELPVPGALLDTPPSRRSSLIPHPEWQDSCFDEGELEAVRSWLRKELNFDFGVDPELLGAVHLVRVDPDLVSVHEERMPAEAGKQFRMRIVPTFRGDPTTAFTFTLRRERPYAEETPISFPLVGEQMLELPDAPFMFSTEVSHERRGLIWREGPAMFLDGVTFVGELVVRSRDVRVEATGGRAPDSYSVPLVNDPEVVEVLHEDARDERTAAQILSANRARAEKRQPPYQQWFDGSADAAAPAIRELIKRTRLEAWLVDPYFDEVELRRFALAVGRIQAKIKVLTSAEGLRSNARRAEEVAGAHLLATVNKAGAAPGGRSDIEVHVMTGARPDIHDRFLRVDDALWLLGASLNEFGSRGTMLVAIPDPDTVLRQILDAWKRATPLVAWMKDRKRRRANPWWPSWWKRPRRHHLPRLGRAVRR